MNKPSLLVIGPHPGGPKGYGRVTYNLISRWQNTQKFETIQVWAVNKAPPIEGMNILWSAEPLDSRLKELGSLITSGPWTHILIIGPAQFCAELSRRGVRTDSVNAFIYSYVFVDDDTAHPYYTNIIDGSDFVVTPTIGCRKIIEEATLITSHQEGELSKPRFKTCKSIKVLPCGVDTNIFKKSPELDKNAIRQAMFDGQVKPGDRLCMISGTKNRQKGIPQAIQTIKALQDIDTHNSYKLYIHMPSIKLKNQTIDLQELIDGNDLKDVFIGDAHFDEAGYHTLNDSELCTIYQAMDCIIIPNIQDGWSFTVHECMACEVLTAISDDHVFHEQVGEGSIKLPCTDYGYAPWNIHEYCRTISPASSARKIIQSFKMKDEIIQTGKAIAHSPKYSWDVIANQWLELMSV